MAITFTLAEAADLPAIVAIYNQAIPTRLATADLTPVTVAERQAWFEAHDAQRRPLWVIKNDAAAIIGWLSFSDYYGRPAYEKTVELSIYLVPICHGQGIGQQALTFAESQARELAITTILAFIFGHNEASQRLFKKNEYQHYGHLPQVAELDGVLRDVDILGKKICH